MFLANSAELAKVEERPDTRTGLYQHNNSRFGTGPDSGSRDGPFDDSIPCESRPCRCSVGVPAPTGGMYRVRFILHHESSRVKVKLTSVRPVVSALARKYGKRPQFVFAGVMGIIGTAVCISANTDYDKLMAGRLLQGFGTTAFESLSVAVIGDLYFVHERPLRTGAITLTLTCIASLVSIIGGPITANLGWRYLFIIHLPFVVVGAIGIFFFLPETQFIRTSTASTTQQPQIGRSSALPDERSMGVKLAQTEKIENINNADTKIEPVESDTGSSSPTMRKKTYMQELALFSGKYTDESIVKLLFTPLAVLLNPAVIWVGPRSLEYPPDQFEAYELMLADPPRCWTCSAYIIAQIWSGPPYHLTPAGNGYFFVGGLLGGIIGGLPGAYIVDVITKALIRRNQGTYEPEFRIPAQIVSVMLYALGWFLWMWDVEHPTPKGYFLGAFCHGCICAGITVATVSANLYIL
ncbi:uncharacterized protein A1O9_01606 [Exophiala aquamarina CBS 119918]|uniref:Major facilitator superfamily (MFS) profile domain-containing protein n=1 Tax=Exophiala aquamarina CBS 119918 TaxID=1182545 RepID=A0A072PW76_9EURO|nr:uncharacterized protein A1O9_01606 [Exophiala aquamarina CBS 119918]KEF63628.1 hypothetical protein A1O9_01606 [Exophiala aquamarina CBS 119918]